VAKTVVNPTAELPPRASDVPLTLDQLGALSVFATIKKAPSFSKFPGSYVLRHYHSGEVICHQGQAGWSAFYMLPDEDLAALGLASGPPAVGPRRLATARLLATGSKQPATKTFWQRLTGGGGAVGSTPQPQLIPNDGPTDINYESREAAIFSGEVFGEMSCLTRQPRSATVVADGDCYALEILRNVLDQMRKDPQYKQQSEQKYRDRVLEGHLRGLSLFALLTPDQFRQVVNRVELVEFAPGAVLWDEGDPPTAVYVVRTGMVQVLKSFPWRLKACDIANWQTLVEKLLAARESPGNPLAVWWSKLSSGLQEALVAVEGEPPAEIQQQFLTECDELAKKGELASAKEMAELIVDERYQRDGIKFDAKVKNWMPLQFRRGSRLLFHLLMPDVISTPEPVGIQRVLRYLGRGDALGEIGLALNQPRTATCVAYAHSDATIEATNIELVRVPADLFRDLVEMSPQVKTEVQRMIAGRTASDQQSAASPIQSLSQSSRAEELGILQGQKLMLIDLNRCTRCGDCVQACIDTHDDGHSRLFLDGPRFGDYLIPSSCRNCRDPVCMIGCPVGSIQQGDNGQVVIRDWCIGCGVCARQCPYDSIQMHDESLIPTGTPGWRWLHSTEPPGKKWSARSYRAEHWLPGVSPFEWNIENALVMNAASSGNFYFRYEFTVEAARLSSDRTWRFLATTKGQGSSTKKALELYVDGELLHLEQDAPQAKRGEYVASLPLARLGKGTHVVAARVAAPVPFAATIFDLRLDLVTGEREDTEEKLVTERAVVCDQCSTLSGKRQACVYACPHEAAMRVDSWVAFPGW
jgi:CRP-like cAMP-binding protein/Fe-S-cluster-containing hydrogenase component 2